LGLGTNFTLTNTNNYIASFLTDVGDPNQLNIPAGNWNCELYFNVSNNSGNPSFYIELYKYDGVTFTLIASSSTNPEFITNGTEVDLYTTAIPVPQTTLLATDRLAVRVHVNTSGNRTVTLHTEDNNLCQVITTFSTGLNALNGLTAQVQNFAVGTSGTDFAISSISPTHTFNLPTASAANRGALSSADWSTFDGKQNALGFTPENVANKQTSVSTNVAHYYNAPYINALPSASLYRVVDTNVYAITGSGEQIAVAKLIPANTFANGDMFEVACGFRAFINSAGLTPRLRLNTSNSLSGATLLGVGSIMIASPAFQGFKRSFTLRTDGFLNMLSLSSLSATDEISSSFAPLVIGSINWSIDQWILFTVQSVNINDACSVTGIRIRKL
jgi:hypothetical protein